MSGSFFEKEPVPKVSFYSKYVKRFLDIVLSGIALLVLSPILLIITILELVFHGRPVLYKQKRIGKDEEEFNIYKFRTMTNEKDEFGELLPSCDRITSFGRFLRRFSLDELPELVCIISGKMSIIGPRPLLPVSLPYYTKRHRMRHSVRPGLACEPLKPLETWSWNDQFENDIFYVENVSFILDLCNVFSVAREAIKGSEYRVEDTREEYNGDNLFEDAKSGGK